MIERQEPVETGGRAHGGRDPPNLFSRYHMAPVHTWYILLSRLNPT